MMPHLLGGVGGAGEVHHVLCTVVVGSPPAQDRV
jgi:hypothetical protein